jgi:hypothetical protein
MNTKNLLKNPVVILVILALIGGFMYFHYGFTFLGAAGAYNAMDVRIVSVNPVLDGSVLMPGSTMNVKVVVKNYGNTTASAFRVEHRLLAEKNYPQYLAVVSPSANAKTGEDDSVVTKQVTDLKAGESVDVDMKVPVPTSQSKIAGSVNNWDDEYIQIVGIYLNAGQGYINNEYKVFPNVIISDQYAGQTFEALCTIDRDCSGWLLKTSSCKNGKCVSQPFNVSNFAPAASNSTSLNSESIQKFYNDYTVLVWIGGIALGTLLLLGLLKPKNG